MVFGSYLGTRIDVVELQKLVKLVSTDNKTSGYFCESDYCTLVNCYHIDIRVRIQDAVEECLM